MNRHFDVLLIVMRLRYIRVLEENSEERIKFCRDGGKCQPLTEEAFEFAWWLLLLVSCERKVNYLEFEFFCSKIVFERCSCGLNIEKNHAMLNKNYQINFH